MESIAVKHAEQFAPSKKFYLVITSLFVLALVASIASTSLSIALPTIASKLHLSTTEAFWLGISSSLASTALQPSCASLADSLGRKVMLAGSVIFLATGSLAATLAQGFTVLIIGRTLLGIGFGGVTAMSDIVVTDIVPLRFRGQYLAYVSIAWAIGTVSGPVVGGSLAKDSTWRWIFGMNIPICAVALVMTLLSLSSFTKHRLPLLSGLGKVDWIGFVVFTSSLIGILITVMQARVIYPWNDLHTIIPLVLSSVGMMCFCVYEKFLAKNPLIPFIIFKHRSTTVTYACTTIHGLVLACLLYYLPLYYEAVKGMSPVITGLAILPETLTLVPASVITGVIITRTGVYRWAIWMGWIITTIGMGLLMFLDVDTPTQAWIGLNLVIGIGTGLLFGAMGFAVQASVDPESIAIAVCMFLFFRSFGSTVGITVGGTVFQNSFRQQLEKFPEFATSNELVTNGVALVAAIKDMPQGTDRTMLIEVYAKSLRTIWLDMCIISGIGLIFSIFIEHYTLDIPLPSSDEDQS